MAQSDPAARLPPPVAWLAPWQRARRFIDHWLFRLRGPEDGTITQVQRRIFIRPTRHGLVFALMLAVMLTGAINYTLSLGYVLAFLLAGLAVVAILHTFRNLAGLRIAAGKPAPVFAGETAHFPVWLHNAGRPRALRRLAAASRLGRGLRGKSAVPRRGDGRPDRVAIIKE